MATITFLKSDLVKESGLRKPEETVPKIGMEVENDDGREITIDITPNRPDLLDIVGLSRQLALHEGVRKPRAYSSSGDSGITVKAGTGVKAVRPYIAALVIKDVSFTDDSLRYLINFSEKISETLGRNRRKLAMGIHDLSAIKGDLTYDGAREGKMVTLLENKEMDFADIIENTQKGTAYKNTVMGKNKKTIFPFLKDSEKIISLIPITNSSYTKTTVHTKSLFIDITGTDANVVSKVADIFACRFIDAGAKVYSVKVLAPDSTSKHFPELKSETAKIKTSGLNEIIGYKATGFDIGKLAAMSGYILTNAEKNGSATVSIPPYRYDVLNNQDVYEDLMFAYGYDNVESRAVPSVNPGKPENFSEFENAVTETMIGLGYTEAYNNYLTNEKYEFELMEREHEPDGVISIKYAKTENISIMRCSILPALMRNLSDSSSEPMPYKIFEIGDVFGISNGKVIEGKHMAFVSEHAKADFAEAKSIVIAILTSIGIKASFEQKSDASFITGRCAAVMVSSRDIGAIGELHPKVLNNFGIEEPVVGCEIDLAKLESKYMHDASGQPK
jgi:phenylalanyl-tRNA synthetase beta chain